MKTTYYPRGVFSAQWLPVDETGRLDHTTLAAHMEFERCHGVRGILALGSTGEFPFFTVDERKAAVATIAELAAGMSVIVNISDIRPQVAVELGRFAKAAGADAVALMPPMFFPVAPADILAYFLHVGEQVDLPMMLYNFPELTGKRLAIETVAAFADRAPMAAIKQSGAEFDYHRELIALGKEKDFV